MTAFDRDPDRARHRQDDRPQPAAAGARRRVRRGRLPAGARATTSPPSACRRCTCGGRRRSSPARTWRWGRSIGFPHGYATTEEKVDEAHRALADGATELDMVIQIGALKSGRDADVQADIAAVVEVAHAAGAIVKVIFENAYLTDDEKVRACRLTEAAGADFVKTSTGFAPSGATHDDLRLMRASTSPAHRRQGRRRRPHARRAAGRHGPRRDPDRGDRDRRRSSTTSGPARRAQQPAPVAAGATVPGRGLLMAARRASRRGPWASACSGPGFIGEFHTDGLRYVPDTRVAANYGAGRSGATRSRRATAAGPTTRSTASAPTRTSTSSSSRSRTTSTSRRSGPRRRHGKGVACTKPLGPERRPRPPRCSGSSRTPDVFNAYLENIVYMTEMMRMREMVEAGSIGRPTTFRAREGHSGPHAAHFWDAELAGGGALLDMASHGIEAARYILGKDDRAGGRVRLGRHARPQAAGRPARTTRS